MFPESAMSCSQTFVELAVDLLRFKGVASNNIDSTYTDDPLYVCRFRGKDMDDGDERSGWIVGGHLPHLVLGDVEISTPFEALVIYSQMTNEWIAAKGVVPADDSVPDLRVPPDWHLLAYPDEYLALGVTPKLSRFLWQRLGAHEHEIVHENIRRICEQAGYFRS